MPSIASHYAVCTLVCKKLNVNPLEFYKGNILPDIINKSNSHYKEKGTFYLVPNITKFLKENKIDNDLNKGYLCHLLLDKYFLEKYVPTINGFDKIDLFRKDNIYKDYSSINKTLIDEFNINLSLVNEALDSLENVSDYEKYKSNKKSINNTKKDKTNYIEIETYIEFLYKISDIIVRDIINLEKDGKNEI